MHIPRVATLVHDVIVTMCSQKTADVFSIVFWPTFYFSLDGQYIKSYRTPVNSLQKIKLCTLRIEDKIIYMSDIRTIQNWMQWYALHWAYNIRVVDPSASGNYT